MSINLIDTKFLNYNIRSCIIEDTEMFLVSDLLRQYNEINNKNKKFSDYLKNKQSQELLKFFQNDTVGENSPLSYENEEKWDIPKVIHYITIPIFDNGANKGYVVCEELLIASLMWCDPIFATQIYDFIKNLRKINNDRFTEILHTNKYQEKQIELLQDHVNKLQDRYIINDDTQQWTYVLKISKNDEDGEYHVKSRYSKYKYVNKDDEMNEVYYIRNLPNGYTYKYFIYKYLLPIIEQYNGEEIGNKRTHFVIPADSYDKNDKHLDYLIRNALKQTLIDLCWKID